MPNKGHRAASRQAQLQKRRRRGAARTQVFDAGPSEDDAAARRAVLDEEAADTADPRPAAPQPRPLARHAAAASTAAYPSIRPELTRIGVLTIMIVLILAVLAVFLGR